VVSKKIKFLLSIVSIIAVVCAVYWKSLLLPFIQDDWFFFRTAQANDSLAELKLILTRNIGDPIFYRPLAQVYLFLMYKVFGSNPIPFHLAVLTIHVINSCLVVLILNKIVIDPFISYLTGLIYAAAIAIHLDPLAWAVGIYDVGGAFFFFLSFWLFMKNNLVVSAIVYFLGCLVKESVIILPFILVSYSILEYPRSKLKDLIHNHWKHTLPFLLAMVVVFIIRMVGVSPFNLPAAHPYVIDLMGKHVSENILNYQSWMLQAFFPFPYIVQHSFRFFTLEMVLVLLYVILAAFRLRKEEFKHQHTVFLFVWLLLGLLHVLFLPNHKYRYYSTYSLPAFVGSILLLLKYILLSIEVKRRIIVTILILISSAAVIGSIFFGNQIYSEGLYQNTLCDGTNQLIRRASFVEIVRKGLNQYLPSDPSNSFIVIGNCDLWSFNKDSGPQFWYNNGTIRVYALSDLKFENGLPYIDNPTENQVETFTGSISRRVFLNPSRLFVFQILNEEFVRVDLNKLK
jgi:hypothetical protein